MKGLSSAGPPDRKSQKDLIPVRIAGKIHMLWSAMFKKQLNWLAVFFNPNSLPIYELFYSGTKGRTGWACVDLGAAIAAAAPQPCELVPSTG